MKPIRSGKIGLCLAALALAFSASGARGETTLVKTAKGYRLSILPAMGAEKVERKPKTRKGKVRIESLRETVYGREGAAKKVR